MYNKFSFILPAYKAKYFHQAIESILKQTCDDFELVIVNDASLDDLDSIVNSFDDHRIRYYKNKENIGGHNLVAQWNKCLEYATGEYVVLASDDDCYFPEYLSEMAKLVDKYPDVNVLRPRVQIIDAEGSIQRVEGYLSENIGSLEFIYFLHRHLIFGGIPYYMFKTEALRKTGGFVQYPMAWGSDDMTVIKLSIVNGIATTNKILFSFRMSGDNITAKKNDYGTLMQKILARDMFYKDQTALISGMVPKSTIEKFYLNYLSRQSEINIIQSIYELLCDSTFVANLRCLPIIRTLPYIKPKWLIISYAKRICQTIIYR